jgi:hypothetical protein
MKAQPVLKKTPDDFQVVWAGKRCYFAPKVNSWFVVAHKISLVVQLVRTTSMALRMNSAPVRMIAKERTMREWDWTERLWQHWAPAQPLLADSQSPDAERRRTALHPAGTDTELPNGAQNHAPKLPGHRPLLRHSS